MTGYAVRSDGRGWRAVDSPESISADEVFSAVQPQSVTTTDQPISMTPFTFIERFTQAEQLAVVTAAMQSPALRLWYDKLMAAQIIVFDDGRLISGMNSLVTEGLITQARHDEILS